MNKKNRFGTKFTYFQRPSARQSSLQRETQGQLCHLPSLYRSVRQIGHFGRRSGSNRATLRPRMAKNVHSHDIGTWDPHRNRRHARQGMGQQKARKMRSDGVEMGTLRCMISASTSTPDGVRPERCLWKRASLRVSRSMMRRSRCRSPLLPCRCSKKKVRRNLEQILNKRRQGKGMQKQIKETN